MTSVACWIGLTAERVPPVRASARGGGRDRLVLEGAAPIQGRSVSRRRASIRGPKACPLGTVSQIGRRGPARLDRLDRIQHPAHAERPLDRLSKMIAPAVVVEAARSTSSQKTDIPRARTRMDGSSTTMLIFRPWKSSIFGSIIRGTQPGCSAYPAPIALPSASIDRPIRFQSDLDDLVHPRPRWRPSCSRSPAAQYSIMSCKCCAPRMAPPRNTPRGLRSPFCAPPPQCLRGYFDWHRWIAR